MRANPDITAWFNKAKNAMMQFPLVKFLSIMMLALAASAAIVGSPHLTLILLSIAGGFALLALSIKLYDAVIEEFGQHTYGDKYTPSNNFGSFYNGSFYKKITWIFCCGHDEKRDEVVCQTVATRVSANT